MKLSTASPLLSGLLLLLGCATAPSPSSTQLARYTNLDSTIAVKQYKDLTVGVIFTDTTKHTMAHVPEHMKMWVSPGLQEPAVKSLYDNMMAPFSKTFKSVEKIRRAEDAKEARADVVAILNVSTDLPKTAFGDCTVTIQVALVTPDNQPIDVVSGTGLNGDYLRVDEKIDRASADAGAQVERAFHGSGKLAAFAKAAVATMVAAKPPTQSVTQTPTAPAVPARDDVDQLPPAASKPNKNAYAVVIGIEQYREKLPKADFADRDAKLVGDYLTKVMGYPEENVVVRTNDKASMNDFVKYLEHWLPNNVEKDSSVFIYYSGHGAPNTKTGDAYLVPYDGDPTFVDSTGYPMKRLYAALDKLPAKDITVVLDSCFSGAGGRSVIGKGLRPMIISVENPIIASGKTVVLAASSGDQVSSTYEEKGHGLLTYFFLKGLQGEGDLNKDGTVDMAELFDYVKPQVKKVARKQYNNEQTPQLLGNPDILKRGGNRLIERLP